MEPLYPPANTVYTPFFLSHIYDPLVVHFANRFTWRCSSRHLLTLYQAHLSADHLDVGPGSGWYLAHAYRQPGQSRVAILDNNEAVLQCVRKRLQGIEVETIKTDLLKPIDLDGRQFDSIALTHVLHCLPGPMSAKASVLENLAILLRPGGTLFGSTILGLSPPQTRMSTRQLQKMNGRGIFDNLGDTPSALKDALDQAFSSVTVWQVGNVALFRASTR